MSERVLCTLWDSPRLVVRLEFKLADAWVGAFWKRATASRRVGGAVAAVPSLDVWVCALPCLPLHVRWTQCDAKENG